MTDGVLGGSILRQSLLAIGATVGASGIFVLTLTLALVALADRAVTPSAEGTAAKAGDKPAATAVDPKLRAPGQPGRPNGGRT